MSAGGTPARLTPPEGPGGDEFAHALRGFGPVGIVAMLVIALFSGVLGPLRAALPLAWAWRSRTPIAALGLARPTSWLATISLGIVLGVALKLAMKAVVMPLLGAPPRNAAYGWLEGNTAALPGVLFAVVVGAGLGEELVFRGFLFERLRRWFGDSRVAITAIVLGTSLFFGLGHLPEQGIPGAQQATITGILMGTIYAASGNLWLPIVAHAAFDVVAVFIIHGGLETRIAQFFFR